VGGWGLDARIRLRLRLRVKRWYFNDWSDGVNWHCPAESPAV
jgi:hypothetical protein